MLSADLRGRLVPAPKSIRTDRYEELGKGNSNNQLIYNSPQIAASSEEDVGILRGLNVDKIVIL